MSAGGFGLRVFGRLSLFNPSRDLILKNEMIMNSKRYRPCFQNLESRRLLAADAGFAEPSSLDTVSALIASDVNADGNITASDALEVINELNATELNATGLVDDTVSSVREAVDVNGDGELSAVDALRVINRLQSDDVRLVDSVMRLIPEAEDTIEGSLRDSISGLIDQLNSLRSQVRLPREAVANVVSEITGLVQAGDLTLTDRTSLIVDRVTNIVESVGLDNNEVRQITDRVEEVIESLPDSLTNIIESIDDDILAAAEQIVGSLDEGFSLVSVGNLISTLRDLDLDVRLPSLTSVFDFVDIYRATTADRTFSGTELEQLRSSAEVVLTSAGIDGELRDDLLDGFDRIIRLRF